MIAPMLAVPMSKANILDWNDWMMEEKFDGHRLVVEITAAGDVTAHTRERKHAGVSGKSQLTKDLPPHLVAEFKRFAPRGLSLVLDGELLATLPDGRVGTSTDVTRTDLQSSLRFVAFDVLMTQSGSCMMLPYETRRGILEERFAAVGTHLHIVLADARECIDMDTVSAFTHQVWDRGGEGLILKNKRARYEAGKRREAFVKIKNLFTAVIKVTGFEATRGTVMNRGPFATVVGVIVEAPPEHQVLIGKTTSVKTKDDVELRRFQRAAGDTTNPTHEHPALGRLLRIEYNDVAADSGVRHPRWDRWEEE